ncbi:hypothetical protein J4E91_008078, partial [Alternaria rosae]
LPPNADLSIIMTLESKPRRCTKKYRAIKRPDGIIVEHPRYRPAGTLQKPTRNPEWNLVSSNHVGTQHKHTQGASPSDMRYDLAGMGMGMGTGTSVFVIPVEDTGRDSYPRLRGGRGGYNEVARELTPVHSMANECKQQYYDDFTPIARFLSERGPWSPYSSREDTGKDHGSYSAVASSMLVSKRKVLW